MKPMIPTTALAVLSLAVGSAVAQQSQPTADELLQQYDRDNDQALSEQEFDSLYQERIQSSGQDQQAGSDSRQTFGELDTNRDERLSDAEVDAVIVLIADPAQGQSSDIGAAGQDSGAGDFGSDDTGSRDLGATGQSDGNIGQDSGDSGFGSDDSGSQDLGATGQSDSNIGQDSGDGGFGSDDSGSQDLGAAGQSRDLGGENDDGAFDTGSQTENDLAGTDRDTATGAAAGAGDSPGALGANDGASDDSRDEGSVESLAMEDPGQLGGETVFSDPENRESLAEIQEIVRDSEGRLHAVVSSEDLFQIDDMTTVPLSDLRMVNDDVVYEGQPQELERMFEEQPYQEEQYEPLEDDGLIS